jgi:signal transduction histidine kinase
MLDEAHLRSLLEVSRSVVSELDLERILRRVLEAARDLTGARYAALGILDEQRRELERFITLGIDDETHRAIGDLPRGRGVLGVLISDPQPLRLDDVSQHPRSYGFPLNHPEMTTFLGVPVLVRGEAYGNLYLTDKEGGEPFDDTDEATIVGLAAWAGVAIANARSYLDEAAHRIELQDAVRALEATTAIARALGGETDLDRILELIAKRARALIEARGVLIMLRDGDELAVSTTAGSLGGDLAGVRIPIEGSLGGHVLHTRRPERLAHVRDRIRFALAERLDVENGLYVPLLFRGQGLGVLAAFDRQDGAEFSAADQDLLESFAASAATAVATAQRAASDALRRSLEASERERTRWARELHDETLQDLAGLNVLLTGALAAGEPAVLRDSVEAAVVRLADGIDGLRRLITDLRPATLDQLGLEPALRALAGRAAESSGARVKLHVDLEADRGRLAPALEETVYRLVQEALTNVARHAAAGHVQIAVVEENGRILLVVRDDGAGFDRQPAGGGFGLLGMTERAALAGGRLEVASAAGRGTTVRADLPATRPGEAAPMRT